MAGRVVGPDLPVMHEPGAGADIEMAVPAPHQTSGYRVGACRSGKFAAITYGRLYTLRS